MSHEPTSELFHWFAEFRGFAERSVPPGVSSETLGPRPVAQTGLTPASHSRNSGRRSEGWRGGDRGGASLRAVDC